MEVSSPDVCVCGCVVSDEPYRDDVRSQACCKGREEVEDTARWISGIVMWLSVLFLEGSDY